MAKAEGITIAERQSFLMDPSAAVANLKRQDARIIVGLFYAKAARRVLCRIYRERLYGPKYVWFFIGWYEDDWFRNPAHLASEGIGCTAEQMAEAAEGHFTTEALMRKQDNSPTISGRVRIGSTFETKSWQRACCQSPRLPISEVPIPIILPAGGGENVFERQAKKGGGLRQIGYRRKAKKKHAEEHPTIPDKPLLRALTFLSPCKSVEDFDAELSAKLLSQEHFAANVRRGIMPEGYLEAPLAYDAIWAVALGE